MIRAALALVLVIACAQTPAPEIQLIRWWDSTPRQPTTMHAYIYEMMVECTGIERGPFSEIRWLSAGFVQRSGDYQRLGGLYFEEARLIVLDNTKFNDPVVVSEELLHDLLRGAADDDDHENPLFKRCVIKEFGEP